MTITALPALNQSASSFRDDADLYFNTELPQFSIELDNGWSEINASTVLAQQEAQFAINQVTLAQNEALLTTQQAQAAALSAGSVGAIAWVSGTTYTIGISRYSPLNSQVYRRIIAGAGTTDPSLDFTNWTVVNSLPNQNIVLPKNNLPQVRPSLSLDFANAQMVDPRITFTRASTATRTNNKGLIQVVSSGTPRIDYDPISLVCKGLLIEEARTNLLTYSEAMDNAIWIKTNSTVNPNATTAPDGTLTADKLVEATGTVSPRIGYNFTASPGTVYAESIYLKAGERTQCHIIFHDGVTVHAALLNLATGTVSANVVPGVTDTSATTTLVNVGNGWYRVSIPKTAAGTAYQLSIRIYNAADAYTGDGTSGLFIWGAQLEAGAFPTTYQPSTETFTGRASTATFYGSNGLLQTAASGVARYNYNPANLTVAPKLLLEAAGTNLLTYSEQFDNAAWIASLATVTPNAAAAPDGLNTADSISYAGTGYVAQAPSYTSGVNYTHSLYVKALAGSVVKLRASGAVFTTEIIVAFNLSTQVVTVESGNISSSFITSVGGGWFRVGFNAVATATASGQFQIRTATDSTSFYIWGAQLEASPYATSYIPTVASQVTRIADTSTSAQTTRAADMASMTGVNFSSWYRSDEGSFVVGFDVPQLGRSARLLAADDGTTTNMIDSTVTATNTFAIESIASGVYGGGAASANAIAANARQNSASAYSAGTTEAACLNGGTIVTANITLPSVTLTALRLGGQANFVGQLNGTIRSLSFFPKRLSNAELQALSRQ